MRGRSGREVGTLSCLRISISDTSLNFTHLSGMINRLTRQTDVVKSDPERKTCRFWNKLDLMLWVEGHYVSKRTQSFWQKWPSLHLPDTALTRARACICRNVFPPQTRHKLKKASWTSSPHQHSKQANGKASRRQRKSSRQKKSKIGSVKNSLHSCNPLTPALTGTQLFPLMQAVINTITTYSEFTQYWKKLQHSEEACLIFTQFLSKWSCYT